MRKILVLLLFTFFIQLSYSQSINKIVGKYHLQSGSHDPQGGVNLILTDQYQYVFAYFGGMQVGTWKECDGNLIMQPDTTNRDAYYVSGRRNPEIPKDSISIYFGEMTESSVLCSFDQSGKNSTMHPVYNKDPNCLGDGKITLKQGKYDGFSMMSAPQIFEDMEYDVENTGWEDALMNYLKDKKRSIESTDTIKGIKYTFPLSTSYNEYRIVYNPKGDRFLFPSLGVFQGSKLYIGNDVYRKSGDLNSLSDGDKEFLEELPFIAAERPDGVKTNGDEMLRSQLKEAGLSDSEIKEYLSQLEEKFKAVPYIRKERVKADYDLNNIITNTCLEHGIKSTRKSYMQ